MLQRSQRLLGSGRSLLPLAAAAWAGPASGLVSAATAPAAAADAAGPSRSFITFSSLSEWAQNHRHSTNNDQQPRSFASLPSSAAAGATAAADERRDSGSATSTSTSSVLDPFSMVRAEIDSVSERLRRCLLSEIPTLEEAAEYFFRAGREGKRLRSTIVLLMATSLAAAPPLPADLTVDDAPAYAYPPDQRRRAQRVAEIIELIHVASLLHDDVIDGANRRRGLAALNALFGNKIAILAGDFLLARASVTIASLRSAEIMALMGQILEHLVAGELMQLTAGPDDALSMEHYMRKTFYKTASLMANACKAVAVVAGCPPEQAAAAWDYGHHTGLAFQLVDDILDFTGTAEELGKPAGNDLRSGLATAPVLFAAQQRPELVPLIKRRFREEGDVERALELVESTDGLARARALAEEHSAAAAAALGSLPPAESPAAVEARAALEEITRRVINRKK